MPDILQIVGANLYRLRNKNGFSQEKFSTISGIEISEIELFEKGESDMYILTLAHIATIFGVSLSEMLQPPVVEEKYT